MTTSAPETLPTRPILSVRSRQSLCLTHPAEAGAIEFLTKPFRDDVLLNAVRGAIERSRDALRHDSEMQRLRERDASLTSREREVTVLVVSGLLNKQVGGELGIGEITVKADLIPVEEVAMRLRCLALACAVLGGCRSADAPPAPMPPAVVVASPLVIRLTEWDEYTGRFEATDTVDVRARVDGYLDSIHFRDGAIVKPGDLLFVIDPRPYEAVLEGARADVVRAQTRLELATTDFTRGEALFAIKGISQEEFDARAQARKEAEAAVIVARATERTAALNVEFTQVRAPIGGRISRKFVSVGNVISGGQAGSTLLTTIVAVDPIQFVFDASESDYLKYNRMNASGERRTSRDTPNPVRIRLLDEPSFTHVGKMDFVDNRVDTATGTILVAHSSPIQAASSRPDSSAAFSSSALASSMRCSYPTAQS